MEKILGLLGIILPVLLLLIVVLRSFTKRDKTRTPKTGKTIFFNFLSTSSIILLLLIGFFRYFFISDGGSNDSGPKAQPLTVSKHSGSFNESLELILNTYYSMTDAFAASDTGAITKAAGQLKTALENLKVDELKKDSTIYLTALDPLNNAKAEVTSIIKDPSIEEKRGSLNILSDNLRSLLVIVRYDLEKVYWQECGDAFGDDKPGNWLSRTSDVKNPYPLKDNKDCGGTKDTLNYIPVDTTKR